VPIWLKLLLISLALNVPLWLLVGVATGKTPIFIAVALVVSLLTWVASLGWVWVSRRSVKGHS
jgi:drug/metabolite transporter (DMT)-like permease